MKKYSEKMIYCPQCGLRYGDFEQSVHTKRHSKWEKACKEYDFKIMTYCIRERVKCEQGRILYSEEESVENKVSAVEKIAKAYFSRSLEAWDYSRKHPKLNDFMAMLLNTESFLANTDNTVRRALLNKYGKKDGLGEGKSYWNGSKQ